MFFSIIIEEQVDVLVLVDNNKPFCRLAVSDVANVAIAQYIHLVIRLDAGVCRIVGEESF